MQSTVAEKGSAKASEANAREVVRERCSGSVLIGVPGGFPRQAKFVDVSGIENR